MSKRFPGIMKATIPTVDGFSSIGKGEYVTFEFFDEGLILVKTDDSREGECDPTYVKRVIEPDTPAAYNLRFGRKG